MHKNAPPIFVRSTSLFILLILTHALFAELLHLRQVVEAGPALTILDVVELGNDLILSMACGLHCLPEALEFLERYLAILVDIDLVKELARGDFTESTLPVLDGLVLVDGLATINIEDSEHFVHLGKRGRFQLLESHTRSAEVGMVVDKVVTDCWFPILFLGRVVCDRFGEILSIIHRP